jgi:hypothetical protein
VTLVVAGAEPVKPAADIDTARADVERLVAAGSSRSMAARDVAVRTGLPRRDLFRSTPR